ncbi:MAG TPA: stage III sporulation protein AD [Candidatus Coprocola pullicola]|nr:stage III sporulation protein AD [Candidatus Coprocola pullicola]
MNMAQIVATGLIGTVLCVLLKKQSPEISLLIAVATGVFIFISLCDKLGILLTLLEETAQKAGVSEGYFAIVLKVTGIAYLAQFGMQLCIDAGETSIAGKIELAGKIMMMIVSAPVLLSLLDVVMGLA